MKTTTEERKKRLVEEEKELERREALIYERRRLAEAFRPFEAMEEYAKNEVLAFADIHGTTLEAIEKLVRNLVRELSNKAMLLDGMARDKPMWVALGAHMVVENLKAKNKLYRDREKREAVKEEIKRERAPKTRRRTVSDLYKNPIV